MILVEVCWPTVVLAAREVLVVGLAHVARRLPFPRVEEERRVAARVAGPVGVHVAALSRINERTSEKKRKEKIEKERKANEPKRNRNE